MSLAFPACNLAQTASGAAAPYLAEVIHNMTTTKDANGKEVVNVEANLMAHAVVGAVTAYAAGNSALAGASGAAMGEYIAQQMYPGVKREDLTEEQRQTISALGTLAAGLAGGLIVSGTVDAVAGAQAGQNEVSNNMMSKGMLELMKAKAVLDSAAMAEAGKGGANEQAALALTKAVKQGLDAACLQSASCVLMVVVAAQQHIDGAGSKTETVPVNDDLIGGKLVNPAADETKGTSLVTPDRSPGQRVSHTGNTEGAPDTWGALR
ncbi:VENN motif pre-toxin domain-containing protein [Pantoea sp. GABEPS69]|nr:MULTISPECIES: VENN motif pre-toxin domain-containing protein [Pantoea]